MSRYPGVYCNKRRFSRASRGFTLIEILVTISIIALLAGLITTGAIIVQGGAQRSRTQTMMHSLIAAHDEYKAKNSRGQNANHNGNSPLDWPGGSFDQNAPGFSGTAGGAGLSSSERLVVACFKFESPRAAVRAATQGRGVLEDRDSPGDPGYGFMELYDPWDRVILYRTSNDQTGSFDGVNNNLLPLNAFPFLISAGPDGEFGTDDDITTIELGS